MAVENLAARRRKAQSEPRDRFRVEPPIFQIGARRLALQRALELLHKKRRRLAMHLHQRRALLVLAVFFRRALAGTRNRNAALFRNDSHRFGEFAFLHLPHEAEDVTADAASETVINLLHRMDRKRRRFLRMKRAQPGKILPALLQPDVLAHHADNVRLLLHPLRKGSRFRHRIETRNSKPEIRFLYDYAFGPAFSLACVERIYPLRVWITRCANPSDCSYSAKLM